MQTMRVRLNRWFDSRAVQATLALWVALLPEPSPEQLRYCWSCCSILALCAAARARATRAAATLLLALLLVALLVALLLAPRSLGMRTAGDLLAV